MASLISRAAIAAFIAAVACAARPEPPIPLDQDIQLGDLTVHLTPYSPPLTYGLRVDVSSQTLVAARIIVLATIETASGSHQYAQMVIWLPSSTTIGLPTALPVLAVTSLSVIPISLDQIHSAN